MDFHLQKWNISLDQKRNPGYQESGIGLSKGLKNTGMNINLKTAP
jgi:hypothetical protein